MTAPGDSGRGSLHRGGRLRSLLLLVAMVLVAVLLAAGCEGSATTVPSGPGDATSGPGASPGPIGASVRPAPRLTRAPTGSGTPAPTSPPPSRPAIDPGSGLRTMSIAELPDEGREVIDLIAAGGPFDYAQDGATFQNREGVLPGKPKGYYREYTVPTPGSPDRGARRIVMGREGDMYYTDDHYASFRRVLP